MAIKATFTPGAGQLSVIGDTADNPVGIVANHGRVTLSRDVAQITMNLGGIEDIQLNVLGGADNIAVGNLTGTGVARVAVELGVNGAGDGQPHQVAVSGTDGADQISVLGSGAGVTVAGLAAEVDIAHSDAGDALSINAGAGNDTIDASTLPAGVIGLTVDGGLGVDTIVGSLGADKLIGGGGGDTVFGGLGNDLALLGDGNDSFVWNPGDGSDTVEGQAGFDTLVFNGSDIGENIDLSANGPRTRLFRDVGNAVMDANGVERIQIAAAGGPDTIVVNDLTGTGVTQVALDFSALAGSGQGDGLPDTAIANGTTGDDQVIVASRGSSVAVNGLAAQVTVTGAEPGNDSLVINGLAGNDTINAAPLNAGQVRLAINGGSGDDSMFGSQGDDLVRGGQGNDVAFLGAGDDTFVWNPGDGSDRVDGQTGNDTLLFNGANIGEKIELAANGAHALLSRDVANISMVLNRVERVDLETLGGADTVMIDDLSRTDVKRVDVDLGVAGGGGDGQVDTVVNNATNANEAITVTNDNGVVAVSGLAAEVTIRNFEANDRLVINGLGGDDVIAASGLAGMQLVADGGDGDDVLVGSPGSDMLLGGTGDDVLLGGGGPDVLDGGPGNNIVINAAATHAAALLVQFMASSFVAAGDGQAATPIADPGVHQAPLLASPHF